jgi:hypothetical protein
MKEEEEETRGERFVREETLSGEEDVKDRGIHLTARTLRITVAAKQVAIIIHTDFRDFFVFSDLRLIGYEVVSKLGDFEVFLEDVILLELSRENEKRKNFIRCQ